MVIEAGKENGQRKRCRGGQADAIKTITEVEFGHENGALSGRGISDPV